MVNKDVFYILEEYLDNMAKVKSVSERPDGEDITFKPFFTSLAMKSMQSTGVDVKNGGVTARSNRMDPYYFGRMEMRMGDSKKGGGSACNTFALPKDINRKSSRIPLWLNANSTFWGCVHDFNERYDDTLGSDDVREKYVYFSDEEPVIFTGREKEMTVDLKELENKLLDISRGLMKPDLVDVDLSFDAVKEGRYLVNSEGTRIFTSYMRYQLMMSINALDNKGLIIPHTHVWYGTDMGNIPCYDDIMARGETLTSELLDIIKAPLEKNDTLPVILDGENTGVVFHEVIGHSLEAHRMQEDEWGDVTTLFKDKIGEKVAPEFITLYDDPTRQELDGHYQFDEDGVRSQKVMLVENCVLKNYLHSRESAGYFKTRSNGHARAYGSHTPTPRMSNLFVESNNRVSFDELVESLRKECVDQKKPYGLLMEGTNGGLTLPEECFFNTFPSNVFRVYANGKTERVRGAYIVGTPLQVLNNFIQTSDRYSTFSGNCGAESGWIPSVEIAPDALVKSLEINRIPMSSYYKMPKPVLPKPDY